MRLVARRVAGGRSLDLTCALVIGLTLINDGVAVDRRQYVLSANYNSHFNASCVPFPLELL